MASRTVATCWSRSKRRRRPRWATAAASKAASGCAATEPGGDATEVFEVAPRGFVEYGRRNLFGRNQSISVFARASLRTKASTTEVAEGEEEPSGYTLARLPPAGHLSPAAHPRHLQRPARHRVSRTGTAIQLQLHQARRTCGADAPAHPRAQLQRPLRDRAGQAVRGAAGPGRQAAHRPAVSAGAVVDAVGGRSSATPATTRWRPRAAPCSAGTTTSPRAPSGRRSAS